jgi:uncharacterized protein YgfB (UPF0149 family)
MSETSTPMRLPDFDGFTSNIEVLALDVSPSQLHGLICGYLCAGADDQGEAYIRTLLHNKKDAESREAILAIFTLYSISQQQIAQYDFSFQLLLPKDSESLIDRAKAFSEWCLGFTEGLSFSGIDHDQLYDEEAQEALQHIIEFSELDYESLEVDEEDERALVEVEEFTRMAVVRLRADLTSNEQERSGSITH